MSEQGRDGAASNETVLVCPACGTPYTPGDRFCAECGRFLPQPDAGLDEPPGAGAVSLTPAVTSPGRDAAQPVASTDTGLWVLAAKPAAVIGGGVLLFLLAAALLFIGQLDETGTIVMLSICLAPLALIVLLIGLARAILRATGRG